MAFRTATPVQLILLAAGISMSCALVGIVVMILTSHGPPASADTLQQQIPRPEPSALAGPAPGAPAPARAPEDTDERPHAVAFGGVVGQDILKSATHIVLYRLYGERDITDAQGHYMEFDVNDTVGEPVTLNPHSTAEVRRLFTTPESVTRAVKGCDPQYGVKFRFDSPAGSAEIVVCFGCGEAAMILQGRWIDEVDIDPMREALATVVKRLLPRDAVIQSLR